MDGAISEFSDRSSTKAQHMCDYRHDYATIVNKFFLLLLESSIFFDKIFFFVDNLPHNIFQFS